MSIVFGMIVLGIIAGLFLSLALLVWSVAILTVFGKRDKRRDRTWTGSKQTLVEASKLLILMPLIAFFHPLPWVLAGIVYAIVLMVNGSLSQNAQAFLIAMLGTVAVQLGRVLLLQRTTY